MVYTQHYPSLFFPYRTFDFIFGISFKHFHNTIILHDFGAGLIMRDYYPKRSSDPYSNIITDLSKWCLHLEVWLNVYIYIMFLVFLKKLIN